MRGVVGKDLGGDALAAILDDGGADGARGRGSNETVAENGGNEGEEGGEVVHLAMKTKYP